MSTARKTVLDWKKQDPADLVRQLVDVPVGRYVLVPEDEAELLASGEQEELIEAIEEGERSGTVPAAQVLSEMRELIEHGARRPIVR